MTMRSREDEMIYEACKAILYRIKEECYTAAHTEGVEKYFKRKYGSKAKFTLSVPTYGAEWPETTWGIEITCLNSMTFKPPEFETVGTKFGMESAQIISGGVTKDNGCQPEGPKLVRPGKIRKPKGEA